MVEFTSAMKTVTTTDVLQIQRICNWFLERILLQNQFPLTERHKMEINRVYTDLVGRFMGSQIALVQIMNMMIQQNVKMLIKLNLDFWIVFFQRYYEMDNPLDNQHPDDYIMKLLHIMKGPGSRVRPDYSLYIQLLDSIYENINGEGSNPLSRQRTRFKVAAQMRADLPPSEFYRVSVRDLNSSEIVNLVGSFPTIILEDAHIGTFNGMLIELVAQISTGYLVEESALMIQYVLNVIMARDVIAFNVDTYRIMVPLDAALLVKIHRNKGHNSVRTVVKRVAALDKITDSQAVLSIISVSAIEGLPQMPDPLKKSTHQLWCLRLKNWQVTIN